MPTPRRKYFNTTGPCFPEMHYMLPPAARLVGAQLDRYVRDQLYWALHAPRQTGKTTFLQSWAKELNQAGECVAGYVSIERAQGFDDFSIAIPAVVDAIRAWAARNDLPVPSAPPISPASLLSETLAAWAARVAPLPLVVLFDEVDVLEGQAMISFLRQLRDGFAARGIGRFPVSVALVGMRDLKDYLVSAKDGRSVNPGSPFNIKEDSVSLGLFSVTDVQALYDQHTAATGQVFAPGVADTVFAWSGGHPWLVNALAAYCCYKSGLSADSTVTPEHLEAAREALIRDRAVHLDSLTERLKDPRVRRVVQAILIGDAATILQVTDPDVQLTMDLGLVTYDGEFTIANPIYREVLIRTLSLGYQQTMAKPEFRWQTADGQLDLPALMAAFLEFWRKHSGMWESRADYTEAFPHLLLMAFLQRLINGGGQIERECAAGRGRLDLAVYWRGVIHAIEVKLVHPADGLESTREEGLRQLDRYAETLGASTRTLVIFDRREKTRVKPWSERLSLATVGETLVVGA